MLMSTRVSKDNHIQVTKKFFIRDLSFYLLTMLYLLFIMVISQEINFQISIGFLLIYFAYVLVVVI